MSFTDQKRFLVTEEWMVHGRRRAPSSIFCTLCNRNFFVGAGIRWVYANGPKPEGVHSFGNFFVCDECDGDDVLERYQKACALVYDPIHGRGLGHWPVSLAVRCLQLEADLAALDHECACWRKTTL